MNKKKLLFVYIGDWTTKFYFWVIRQARLSVTERLSAAIFGWWFCRFMQAKTADAKLFTSALGACSAGSCWAQASWSGVIFFQKNWPIASMGRTVYLPIFTMKSRAKQQKREVNYTWPMRSICPRVDRLLILVMVIIGWILRDFCCPSIGLMTIPYHREPMGVYTIGMTPTWVVSKRNQWNWVSDKFVDTSATIFTQGWWSAWLFSFTLTWNAWKNKVADLSPIHFRKRSATDGTKLDLNIGESRVWRLDSGPNLQPWTVLYCNVLYVNGIQ